MTQTILDDNFSLDWLDRPLWPEHEHKGGEGSGDFGHPGRHGEVGGSGPSSGRWAPPTAASARALAKAENSIRLGGTESAFLVDVATGHLTGPITSGERVTVDLTQYEKQAQGQIITHNHPIEKSLSGQDVAMALKANMREVRAVTEQSTYRFGRTGATWPHQVVPGVGSFPLTTAWMQIDEDVFHEFQAMVSLGTMTGQQADLTHQHEVLTRLAKMYPKDVYYIKEPHVTH